MKSLLSRGRNLSRSIAPPRAAIRINRRFSAPPAEVFNAWLDPELARQWLFATALHPMTQVEIDAKVEGFFRLAEQRDRELMEYTGNYLEIVRHRRLVFTLSMEEHWYVTTRVTVVIAAMKTGCQLSLVHDDVPSHYVDYTERRWAGILYGLDVTLSGKRGW